MKLDWSKDNKLIFIVDNKEYYFYPSTGIFDITFSLNGFFKEIYTDKLIKKGPY